jgi:hypothetical protein
VVVVGSPQAEDSEIELNHVDVIPADEGVGDE